jgi:hypothetical protein
MSYTETTVSGSGAGLKRQRSEKTIHTPPGWFLFSFLVRPAGNLRGNGCMSPSQPSLSSSSLSLVFGTGKLSGIISNLYIYFVLCFCGSPLQVHYDVLKKSQFALYPHRFCLDDVPRFKAYPSFFY